MLTTRGGHRAADRVQPTPRSSRYLEPMSPARAAPRASFGGDASSAHLGRVRRDNGHGGPAGRVPRGALGQGGGPTYLRMLCASMLRFWLLEQTTATRSGDDGMAVASPSAPSGSGLPPSRGSSARARWRPRLPEVMTRSSGAGDVSRRDARREWVLSVPQASPRGLGSRAADGGRPTQRAPNWRARLCSGCAQATPAFLTAAARRPASA